MQPSIFNRIEVTLTANLVSAYKRPGEGYFDALARYTWNCWLAESFYPSLQGLEISLRNTVNRAFASRHGADWITSGKVRFDAWQQGQVRSALEELQDRRIPADPVNLVPELGFGFWTSTLGTAHEHEWHGLLKNAFPLLTGPARRRAPIAERMGRLRAFRNRVFHHQRLIHQPLPKTHGEILESIGWMNPELAAFIKVTDRFPEVWSQGLGRCRSMLGAAYCDGHYCI